MNISIFGLGYVGTVTAVCLAKNGHRIIGVDANNFKVESINQAKSPIVEPGVDELLAQAISSKRLSATTDLTSAVLQSDISLICVGTPSNVNGSLNLEQVMRVSEQIAGVLSAKGSFHAIVIRSTVLPGTVEKVGALIESLTRKKMGKDFGVASNPEFLREGTSLFDFENPPYTVVGASDQRMFDLLTEMYKGVNAPIHKVKIKEAEILKYACNSFHAVKVTFANEIGALSKKLGIDSHVVMKIFCEDAKLNISPYYLKPGFAFGGSCLPKDVLAITYKSKIVDAPTPLLDSLIPSNDAQIQSTVEWVLRQKKKSVGILGLSFKSDTDDMRESPIVRVAETLLGKGYTISIYDSNVNLSKLIGANRSYIEQEIPHISSLMKDSVDEVLMQSEVIIIANRGKGFREALSRIKDGQAVLDLVRITEDWSICKGTYEGVGW